MTNAKSPRSPKNVDAAALDGGSTVDSRQRWIASDLPLELAVIAGEATLLFAHLRDLLSEVTNASLEKE